MKYAIYFKPNSRYDIEADEILIVYRKRSIGLINWVQKRPENQRIIVDITILNYDFNDDMDIFTEAAAAHPNIAFKISTNNNFDKLKENNIDYFFVEFADTWDKLHSYISKGVSDIYVTNELGFQMKDVKMVCLTHNVKIRVYPNVAQTSARDTSSVDTLTKFFIRPEDTMFYEPYVDTFEFFCPINQQDVYMDIYKRQSWTSSLSILIKDFDIDVISAQLVRFGTTRLNCGKVCSYGKCAVCKHALDFSTLLNDLNIGLTKNEPIRKYTKEEAYEKLRELSYIVETKQEEDEVATVMEEFQPDDIDYLENVDD